MGYCLPFLSAPPLSNVPIPMPSYSPTSIKGAALEEVTLGRIAKGAVELAPLPSPGFYSHLFVVWKTSGSWRPVIDLSHLNRFVDVSPFQMETIQSVLLSVRQGDWMASIDLKEAYLQVPVHPASRHFFRFMFRDTVYQFKALCFGLSTAPQVFTRVMAPVSAILHSIGIRMRRYLDDWLVQSASRESLLRDLHPSLVVQCLGVILDSTSFRASPSEERILRLHSPAAGFSVLRLASRELMALAPRRTCFAGSPSSWRQTGDAVPPALPPSILGSSGSGGSSVCVDGVSSRPPVVAPSPSSVSRSVSLPGVSRPTLLVRRGVGCPSRSSDRFRPVGHPPGGVFHKRQGTACCPTGSSPVPIFSTGSHGGCILRQHHSGGFSSQGGWHKISSPHHLGSGILALDGVPLYPPGSAVPPGLQQRPRGRPVSPSPAPTFRVVPKPDRISFFEKTLAGPNRFICHLRQSSLFDLLLTIPGSNVSRHGRVSPVLGRSSGLRVPSGGHHSACSREAQGLHGDGAHTSSSTLGPAPLVLRPAPAFAGSSSDPAGPSSPLALASVSSSFPGSPSAQASCLATLQRFPRAAGFSSAVAEQSSLARRPSSRAVSQVRWSIYRVWCHNNGHSISRPTLATVADFLLWLRYTRGLSFPPCVATVQCYLRCSVFTFHLCLRIR